ncbi:hypothetical protein QR680_002593 [Steinernema hermaphroditum]|uniref:Lipid-binding serum glycoprotein N-terminal domain-containing protein n=1 Tax=Steinernema hermaphroditum TaxID=289476 RepID=A0AA39H3B6_9BILA|nr:hypothetical protein QR680_002593 [Steinernema hermaphroditum]
MQTKLCLLALFATLVAVVLGTAPGAEIQVNQRGLNAFAEVGVALLNQRIPGMSIPDASSFISEDMHFSWSLWDIKIDKFHVDQTKTGVSAEPSDKLNIHIVDLSFDISARYRIKVKEGWIHARKSGSIEAWTSGANTEVTVAISSESGHPHLNPVYCAANLGDFQIKFHGGLVSKIVNMFRHKIADHLKSKLNGLICREVTKIVTQDGNQALASVPFEYNLGGDASGFHVDYQLTSNPYATKQFIGVPILGKFWYDGHRNDGGIPKPSGAVQPLARNEMVCIALDGQGLFGSATYAFRQSPKSHFHIDSNLLRHFPENVRRYFSCDCSGSKECITELIPEIKSFCRPGAAITIDAEATAFPGFHFNASGAYISAETKGQFKMVLPGGASTPLFELDAKIGILLESNLRIENWVIKGDVKLYDAELSARSPIVPISTNHIQALWNKALSAVVSGIADTILAHGIPIPNLPKTTPIGPKFTFNNHELIFCCDLKPTL